MNLHNIHTIARYEVKLLQRGWLFRIFAILALLFITGVTLWYLTPLLNPYGIQWPKRAVASQMPFFANMYYSIAQSIIVIFLAGSFLKRDKKLDTAEVIYVRPMSNADYIIGKTWGIVQVFLVLNVITLLITAFFHLTLTPSPFRVFGVPVPLLYPDHFPAFAAVRAGAVVCGNEPVEEPGSDVHYHVGRHRDGLFLCEGRNVRDIPGWSFSM